MDQIENVVGITTFSCKSSEAYGRYLLGARNQGYLFKPDLKRVVVCYIDAGFAGGWAKADANNSNNALLRTGFVIFYADCLPLWASSLQTLIALSTAEAEDVALSTAMGEVIALMQLINELKGVLDLKFDIPKGYCNLFEDNENCIPMATKRKFSPCTKHRIKYHHFR